jgi:ubiquinone/menaquinone biosynthesis C-methylase UbiE
MAVDFQTGELGRTYNDRTVTPDWLEWCRVELAPTGKRVVDLGCGGGIYSRGFAELNAHMVIGIDSAVQYVEEANEESQALSNVRFAVGTASHTGLADRSADIVFHRAVIHHLDGREQVAGAIEMRRVLDAGGLCVVQDRTVEDVESTHPDHWIRATLFEAFPRLLETERGRRPSTPGYAKVMRESGFEKVEVLKYSETRKHYASFSQLESEILARKGKSILFELTDEELRIYCAALAAKVEDAPIVEADSWTIWLGSVDLTDGICITS